MPLYEYKCPKCGHEREIRLPLECYDDIVPCNKCWESGMDRVFSTFNFTFGFVRTWKRPGDPEGDRLVRNVSGV